MVFDRKFYIQSLFRSDQSKRPESVRLNADEKTALAKKLMMIMNVPIQPFFKEFDELDDNVLFKSWQWLNDKEQKVVAWMMDNDSRTGSRFC